MDESAQIRHIKQILTDLGMKGRMSLEKAKAIKEQRELAQEMGERRYWCTSVPLTKRCVQRMCKPTTWPSMAVQAPRSHLRNQKSITRRKRKRKKKTRTTLGMSPSPREG